MGNKKNKALVAVPIVILLAVVVVLCVVFKDRLFSFSKLSRKQIKACKAVTAELIKNVDDAFSEATHTIEAKEKDYEDAFNYLTIGEYDLAYIYFDRLKDYKNSKDCASQTRLYQEALFKESKKNYSGAATLMAQCELIPGSSEKLAVYELMGEIITLCRTGEYENAKSKINGLTTLSDEERHDFEISCMADYWFWLLDEEEAEKAGEVLAEIMNDSKWVDDNWGPGLDKEAEYSEMCGFDGKYAVRYIFYDDELGPDKNVKLMKLYFDKEDEPDCYDITIFHKVFNGEIYREFAFSMDGEVLYKPHSKRPAETWATEDSDISESDYSVYETDIAEADKLISKGKYANAGKLLVAAASDERFLRANYEWYGTDRDTFTRNISCDTVKLYIKDGEGAVFGIYYKGDYDEPIGFHYRYSDGAKFAFVDYDMNGKLLNVWTGREY